MTDQLGTNAVVGDTVNATDGQRRVRRGASSSRPHFTPTGMRAYRGMVMVADDDEGFRDAMKVFLEDHRYLVLTARSGAEALARMQGLGGPLVAIVDLLMPGMNGWDLIRMMRGNAELFWIPIIVLTARSEEVVAGADRVLRKPFDASKLLAIVDDLCK